MAERGDPQAAREAFLGLADRLCAGARAGEVLLLSLSGEDSDFVRLNRNRVRQAGHVRQARLGLELIRGDRHALAELDLALDLESDAARAMALLAELRGRLEDLPADPYLSYNTEPVDSELTRAAELPPAAEAVETLIAAAEGLDLVGIWASGWRYDGFASSLGQRNWQASEDFQLDWSLYLHGDKAVKASWSGRVWDPAELRGRLDAMRATLEVMGRRPQRLVPGRYRVYLAPAALAELLFMLCWGGFGLKARRSGRSPLLQMIEGDRRLDARVSLREDPALGLAPGFDAQGYTAPAAVELLRAGRLGEALVGPRSALEYGVARNALGEVPNNLVMDPGELDEAGIAAELGTGILVNNLWYLNYADRSSARITGMTRFASLWVEQGEVQAPVEPMRFDDSVFHILGSGLQGLTRQAELRPRIETYGGRARGGMSLPGALVDGLEFAL